MNKDILEGQWKQIKGKVKAKWAKFTDDDLDYISGRSEELKGTIQKRYGMKKDEADKEYDAFVKTLNWVAVSKEKKPGYLTICVHIETQIQIHDHSPSSINSEKIVYLNTSRIVENTKRFLGEIDVALLDTLSNFFLQFSNLPPDTIRNNFSTAWTFGS